MAYWVKARRIHTLLVASFAATLILGIVLQGTLADIPSFLGGTNPVVGVLLAPVPLFSGLLLCLESRMLFAEETGVRPVRLMDAGLVLATAASSWAASLALGTMLESGPVLAIGRNATFLIGLMLIVRYLVGSSAVIAPAVWLISIMIFGFHWGHPYIWTVLPRDPGDPAALGAALGAILIGTALLVREPQHGSFAGIRSTKAQGK